MLAWMDLEMTGLDPARHRIVEIATLVTDDDLHIVAEGPDLVVATAAQDLEAMDAVVRSMHTRSGLLGAIQSSTISLEDAGTLTLAFLREHVTEARAVPLCGNSIATDRRFLAAWLPEIDEYLHYRSVDVSTVKELARRWYPTEYARAPKKSAAHRALDDIKESVAELAYYRQAIFDHREARSVEPARPARPARPVSDDHQAQQPDPSEPARPGPRGSHRDQSDG